MIHYLIIFFIAGLSVAFADEVSSLSCSKDKTHIIFINGINVKKEKIRDSSDAIDNLIQPIAGKINNRQQVEVSYEYNTSEGLNRDIIQLIEQKLSGNKINSSPKMLPLTPQFLFLDNEFISAERERYLEYKIDETELQNRNSANDVRRMVINIKGYLTLGKKVIVVSHSQGNIYANLVYDGLLKEGVSYETLNKYYGNLQVGSVAKEIRAKNSRYITLQNDRAVNSLRLRGAGFIMPGNYFQLNVDCPDGLCHGFNEAYLSEQNSASGKKQGRGGTLRSLKDIFLDSLEEVAWMLANNDENCCDGRDGRFYRKDYNTEATKGFVEKTASIDKKLTLLMDEGTQICGNVVMNTLNTNSNEEVTLSTLETIPSKIIGDGPIITAGKLTLEGSELINDNPNDSLSLIGNTYYGLGFKSTKVQGAHTISGDIIFENSDISSSFISGSHTAVNIWGNMTDGLLPSINARISGNSTVGGFYTVERDIEGAYVEGRPQISTSGGVENFLNIPYKSSALVGGTVVGFGYIAGSVTNSNINGYKVGNNIVGVILEPNGTVSNNSNVLGAVYLEGSNSISSSIIRGDQVRGIEEYILHVTSSTILNNSSVVNAPRVITSYLNSGHIANVAYVQNSNLTNNAVAQCNAYVVGKTLNGAVAGCGYSKKDDLKDNILEKADSIIQKSISEKIQLTNYYMAAKEEVLKKLKQ